MTSSAALPPVLAIFAAGWLACRGVVVADDEELTAGLSGVAANIRIRQHL